MAFYDIICLYDIGIIVNIIVDDLRVLINKYY